MEQRTFTDGKIIALGRRAKRKEGKKADYILRYSQNFPIAIVEANMKVAVAVQRKILELMFVLYTNKVSFDPYFEFEKGQQSEVDAPLQSSLC